jgi:hypothetical protein
MIDRSFIEKIESLATPIWMEEGDRRFTSRPVNVVLEPTVAPLIVHTLTGLTDFMAGAATSVQMVHVQDFTRVALISDMYGPEKQRETFALAETYELKHRFGSDIPVADFVVYLQSMFVQDATTAEIMRIVGNLTQGTEANFADDGMTQRVTAKAGVARVEMVDLPNPVTLRPYRTFADIEQPASSFVLRIKADKDSGPRCALHEADGGAWKNSAISTIRAWMIGNGPEGIRIIA